MPSVTYKCCRCGSPLQTHEPEQPWPCSRGCGEWLTCEAVDTHLFPRVLTPLKVEPFGNAPCCVVCETAMRAFHAEPFYLCVTHGVWFDQDGRDAFSRVLSDEIAKHQEARAQRDRGC